jgi:hypothetical protein
MVYSPIKKELASQFACKLYRYHIHPFAATEILCGLFAYRLYPRFILRRSFESYNTIKRACFHTAETEAAGSWHFIILIADINVKRAGLFSLAFLAKLAF